MRSEANVATWMFIFVKIVLFTGEFASDSVRRAVLVMGCKMIIGNLAAVQFSTYLKH